MDYHRAVESERRKHSRKRISTGVAFREPNGVLLRGWLVDISRGGCFIASPSTLTFGEPLEIELRLPGVYAQITGGATVVWVREKTERGLPAGMGVRFVSVAESSLAAIDGLSSAGARLSRPSTMIGVAPPPATSSPSFRPPPLPTEEPAVTEPKVVEPEPTPTVRPKRARWIIAGVAAVAFAALAIGLLRRHRHATIEVDARAVDAVVEASTDIVDASLVDATIEASIAPPPIDAALDVSVRDGGRDAGRDAGKPKPKPRHR